jgi:cbb3-type cytochrome oxidase subunit 1
LISAREDKNTTLWFFKAGLAYFAATLILGLLMITGKGYSIFGPQGAKAAHVHAGLLGFVTNIIIGAMYQIVPTLTGTKLYGGRLEAKQFIIFNLGVLGIFLTQLNLTGNLRIGFQIFFGTTILLATILFGVIVFKTIGESKSKIKPVTIPFFQAAIIFLLAGEVIGLLTVAFPRFFSHLLLAKTGHAHLGTLGFITMTIFGAEYQMFPMLSMRKLKSEQWAKLNFWTFTVGVAGFFIGLMLIRAEASLVEQRIVSLLLTLFVAILFFSIIIFIANMLLTLKGAESSKLDVSVKYLLAGHLFLLITIATGSAMAVFYHLGLIDWLIDLGLAAKSLSIYGLIWTHAHLALIGFVSLTIIGAMYHLTPMLVWMEKYGPKLGKEEVPNIQDLFSQGLARLILWSSVIGLFGILIGSLYGITGLLRASAYILAVAFGLFILAMYRIMK